MNIPEIQFQTVFYPGFSKRNITSIQAPILSKKILLADKSDNHYCIVASQILYLLQHGMGLYAKPMEGQELSSSFPEEAGKSYLLF